MFNGKHLNRRSFMSRVCGTAILGGGATALVTGCAATGPYNGTTDADPVDAPGYGRRFSGLTDSDTGPSADRAGQGRAGGPRAPSSGSGFFISADGYLITNSHVVRDRTNLFVLRDGERHAAQVIASDAANDIAILKVDLPSTPLALGSARQARVGEEVIALGYPLSQIQGQEMRATFGRINALSSINSDSRHLQIDAATQPGNSGGPLLGIDGRVIGIVTARLNDLATLQSSGALPENISFALKIDYLTPLLPNGIALSGAPLTGSIEDRVEAARASVVYIVTE